MAKRDSISTAPQMVGVEALRDWIVAREKIRRAKVLGPPPWTDDPILRDYRFCNVRRSDDRVTRWIHRHWGQHVDWTQDSWFAFCVARYLNKIETLETISYPVPFEPVLLETTLREIREDRPVFGAAYMITTAGQKREKIEHVVHHVLQPLWDARCRLRPGPFNTLRSWHMLLGQFGGMGSFMAAQVVADLKFFDPHLSHAADRDTFAASGPGSRRGLNRVLGRDKSSSWTEEDWFVWLGRVRAKLNPLLRRHRIDPLDAQDTQNCLCEFDKYERARLGEGRPKQNYVPSREPLP